MQKTLPLVLVVDDEVQLLGIFTTLLSEHFTVLSASYGRDAYISLLENKDKIDIVIADLMLPHNFLGTTLLDAAIKLNPKIITVLMTGHLVEYTQYDLLLPKPFNFTKLSSMLMELIETRNKV